MMKMVAKNKDGNLEWTRSRVLAKGELQEEEREATDE